MAVSQLGYLGIGVSNMDAWEAYATEVLGMEVSGRADDGTLYLRMDANHHRLALHPTGTDDLAYVGWQTANREEFEATKAKLLAGGVEYAQGTPEEVANRRVVDMVRCEVSSVPMEVFYGPQVLFERPFKPSTPITGFRTGDLGLGHVGLSPDNDEELIRVLLECLDFRVSDSMRGAERFFHCKPAGAHGGGFRHAWWEADRALHDRAKLVERRGRLHGPVRRQGSRDRSTAGQTLQRPHDLLLYEEPVRLQH